MLPKFIIVLLLVLSSAATDLRAQTRTALLSAETLPPGMKAGNTVDRDEAQLQDILGSRTAAARTYGVRGVARQELASGASLTTTLIEMVDSPAAYGLFSWMRPFGESGFTVEPVGAEGYRVGSTLVYWQANFVVELHGDPQTALQRARALSRLITGSSRKPPVSTHLPQEGLRVGSERYLIDPAMLPASLGLPVASLGFDFSLEVAYGHYGQSPGSADLVLLLYPTQQIARRQFESFADDRFGPANARKRVGPLVALVRGTSDATLIAELLDRVNYETKVTWNESLYELSMGEILVTAFMFIGIGLLLSVVAGVGLGGARVLLRWRFKDAPLGANPAHQLIQLELKKGLSDGEGDR